MKAITLFLFSSLLVSCATGGPMVQSVPLNVYSNEPGEYLAEMEIKVDGFAKKVHLDTGARASTLATDNDTKKYPVVEESSSKVVSGKVLKVNVIQPGKIEFGPVSKSNHKIALGHRGLLGLDLLSEYIFQIDLQNNQLNFLSKIPKSSTIYPIKRLKRGHVIVPVKIGEAEFDTIFDSAASITVADLEFVEKHPKLFTLHSTSEGEDGHGNKIISKVYLCRQITIGSQQFKDIKIATFPFDDFVKSRMESARIILGNNVIHKAKWAFDLKSKRVGIEASL